MLCGFLFVDAKSSVIFEVPIQIKHKTSVNTAAYLRFPLYQHLLSYYNSHATTFHFFNAAPIKAV
jgi:hypothetical protein